MCCQCALSPPPRHGLDARALGWGQAEVGHERARRRKLQEIACFGSDGERRHGRNAPDDADELRCRRGLDTANVDFDSCANGNTLLPDVGKSSDGSGVERNVMGEPNMYRRAGTKPNFGDIARRHGLHRQTVAKHWC